MTDPTPDHAEQALADTIDSIVPGRGYDMTPVVGLGGSAGSIQALRKFFAKVEPDCGLAFVVVIHLAADQQSSLAEVLQHSTTMPVRQVTHRERIEPNHVYVIPPGKAIRSMNGDVSVDDHLMTQRGRHLAVDLFLRTLADTHGPHAAAVVLSGGDSDGAIGIKRIKERGGLTVAQDPQEAEQASMPRAAIATGMTDWILTVEEIPARLKKYFALEAALKLPRGEDGAPGLVIAPDEESQLRDVLGFLRTRTGRDFSYYKRATVVRRIARRMQVNGVDSLPGYLACLRTTPGEAGALLQDLLISVTNFFRDADCFDALERHLATMFAGKGANDFVRVWVPACATGEEAYSIAMMLADFARDREVPPAIQVFATDLDEEAVRVGREGLYPPTIEADLSEERLRRYFVKEHAGYRVRRELREMILFAQHDLLKDSPFSRLDLVSCRNLLIYLNRDAQQRAFQIFHFALVSGGHLFLGTSESAEDVSPLFAVVDKKCRIFVQRPVPRVGLPVPTLMPIPAGLGTLPLILERQQRAAELVAAARNGEAGGFGQALRPAERRIGSWGEMHFKLLEQIAPPSILVDAEHEILHVSPSAAKFLEFGGGEPSRNLLRAVHPDLRIEMRAALYRAAQDGGVEALVPAVEVGGETKDITIRVSPARDVGADLYLVVLSSSLPGAMPVPHSRRAADALSQQLDRELERLKGQLRDTVEQYEASTEELKASNEELQAMNEELRSATEELETSREELQSINEELTTVNHELKSKVDELSHSNSDMQNLMDATAIAIVFLDRNLRITRYTPSAVTLFNLIASDLGRPLADLASRLQYPELSDDARRVLERLAPIEREVGLEDGSWFLARLLPYRTIEDRIAGVVLCFIDITERKRAEEVRLWLSAVVASSADAIISFALDQTILSWNAGAERMFGYVASEAIGRPLALLSPGRDEEQAALLERLRSGSAVTNLETRLARKGGALLDVSLGVSPIHDADGRVMGGTAIARDISAQREATEALRASEERLRLIVENATEYAIFSMDLQRRVTLWTVGAQRLLGYSEREMLGESGDIIFTEEDRAAGVPELEMQKALADGRAEDDRLHRRQDASRFWAGGVMMVMRDAAGEVVGFVKVLRDQTQARESREALERSQQELLRALTENEAARAELQRADVAKDRFLAVLSHELRNPLASIAAAAELFDADGARADHAIAATQIIQRQARGMKSLLDDLLDMSRLKLGRIELRRGRVRLSAIVENALEVTRPLLEEAGHRLSVDLPAKDVELEGDALRLGQVLSNLLGNAIRYTPQGGQVTLRARLVSGRLEISVKDTGIGMEPGSIDALFEMFAQELPAHDGSHGLGIGLALVKSIVEMHGGEVTAHSAGRGKGSEFRVSLPGAVAVTAPAAPEASRAPDDASASRGLILVADDNADAGWGMSKLLELAGFETVCVRSGAAALAALREHKFGAAVLDIGMPDLTGHQIAQHIRRSPGGTDIALIAATGWGQQSDELAALAAGFDAHMAKPVDTRKLVSLIDELVQARGKQ
jgi:two-component system CheB/CheR fusion protein